MNVISPFAEDWKWVKTCCTAITERNGGLMAGCISDTISKGFVKSSSNRIDIVTLIGSITNAFRNELPDVSEEEAKYVEMFTRLAATALVYDDAVVEQSTGPSPLDLNGPRNKLLKGLLFAFDSFQTAHTFERLPHHYQGFPGWDTAALLTLVHEIQGVAESITTVDEESINSIVRNWRRLFVSLQSVDKEVESSKSRRRGALVVVNGLLTVLFRHNITHQCRVILRFIEQNETAAETTDDPLKSVIMPAKHLVSEVIKFRYYQGRMRQYDKNYAGAFNSLMEAYCLSPPWSSDETQMNKEQRENKIRIHFYLTVAGIMYGLQPPMNFLSADPVTYEIFFPVVEAIRLGSPAAFTAALDVNGSVLRRKGVFMLLQRARIYCYLHMLRITHTAISEAGKDNTMIPFSLLVSALAETNHTLCDEDSPLSIAKLFKQQIQESNDTKCLRVEVEGQLEVEDMALWLGRLISIGLVKGYLSYEHSTLVLSKKDPFPTLIHRTSNILPTE
eukprot:Tbor_TRINITY_DN3199_c0_g1::TRINITY_DN3199_c0_g1_i1::g.14636::m.14636